MTLDDRVPDGRMFPVIYVDVGSADADPGDAKQHFVFPGGAGRLYVPVLQVSRREDHSLSHSPIFLNRATLSVLLPR